MGGVSGEFHFSKSVGSTLKQRCPTLSPHVATGTFNVATSTISSTWYLLMFLRKPYVLPKNEKA